MASQVKPKGADNDPSRLDLVGYVSCSFGPTADDRRREREGEVELAIQEEQNRRQFLAGEESQDPGGVDPA